MTLSLSYASPLAAAVGVGLLILAAALLLAVRRWWIPGRPVAAKVFATAILAILVWAAAVVGLPIRVQLVALLPAVAVVAMATQPLAPIAWLRATATLAVALTLVAALSDTTLTTVLAATAAGYLCSLLTEKPRGSDPG